jgi:hypothetical protein
MSDSCSVGDRAQPKNRVGGDDTAAEAEQAKP